MRDYTQQVIISFTLIVLSAVSGAAQTARPQPDRLAKAVQEIEKLDALRSSLAGTFTGNEKPADPTTFQQVCKPVAMQAKQMATDNGWTVMQMAAKYRNPKHQLDAEGRLAYTMFDTNPDLMGVWTRTTLADQTGTRYFRRITVESACLVCHGPKDKRPTFITQQYPEDRAYDFQVGDLRGIYTLFIPDAK